MIYKAAFLQRDTGALECGHVIKALSDDMAVRLARTEEHRRGRVWELCGLHEAIGLPELIRVVPYA